jgi:hypothetical protein
MNVVYINYYIKVPSVIYIPAIIKISCLNNIIFDNVGSRCEVLKFHLQCIHTSSDKPSIQHQLINLNLFIVESTYLEPAKCDIAAQA